MSLSLQERARVYAMFSSEVRAAALRREVALEIVAAARLSVALSKLRLEAKLDEARDMGRRWCLVGAAICAWDAGVALGRWGVGLWLGVGP